MKALIPSRAALALIRDAARDASSSNNPFICHACRTHAVRSLHTTRPAAVASEDNVLARMRKRFRPTAEQGAEATRREEERQKDLLRRAEAQQSYGNDLETFQSPGGHEYEIAHVVDRSLYPNYKPAKTWDGLMTVGDEAYVKRVQDPGQEYRGFAPNIALKLSDTQWDNLLHSISVEIIALGATDRKAVDLFASHGDATRWARTQSVAIVPSEDGWHATLSFETPTLNEEVLAAIPEGAVEAGHERPDFSHVIRSGVLDLDQTATTRDISAWSKIKLSDSAKLVLTKRITQLTAKRLPDPIISQVKTLLDLRTAIVRPSPVTKLSESPALQPSVFENAGVSNVSISHRRHQMVAKERSIGRWKVIVDELKKRGIPARGTSFKEMKLQPAPKKIDRMPIRRRS